MKTDDGVGAKAAAPAAITVAATATVSARLAWPLRGQLARQVQEGRPAASVPSVGHVSVCVCGPATAMAH